MARRNKQSQIPQDDECPASLPPHPPSRRGSAAPSQRVELAGFRHGGAVEAAEMGPVGGLLGIQPPRRGGQQQLAEVIMARGPMSVARWCRWAGLAADRVLPT